MVPKNGIGEGPGTPNLLNVPYVQQEYTNSSVMRAASRVHVSADKKKKYAMSAKFLSSRFLFSLFLSSLSGNTSVVTRAFYFVLHTPVA